MLAVTLEQSHGFFTIANIFGVKIARDLTRMTLSLLRIVCSHWGFSCKCQVVPGSLLLATWINIKQGESILIYQNICSCIYAQEHNKDHLSYQYIHTKIPPTKKWSFDLTTRLERYWIYDRRQGQSFIFLSYKIKFHLEPSGLTTSCQSCGWLFLVFGWLTILSFLSSGMATSTLQTVSQRKSDSWFTRNNCKPGHK